MKILITGAHGMLGRAFYSLMRLTKHELLAPTHKELEMTNQVLVENYFKLHKPDCVVHLAACVGGIQKNIDQAVGLLIDNARMSINVIKSALDNNVKKFINIGSSCMYPKNRAFLKEEDLLSGAIEPTNECYAVAKISAVILCKTITEKYNFTYKTIVPCNLYGPYDNFNLVTSHMIPGAINKIYQAKIKNEKEVAIWGDGMVRREFMHVQDAADFLQFALDKLDLLPNIINLGLGHDYSINEYYSKIAKMIDYSGSFWHDLTKPAGATGKLLNIEKLQTLGWQAKIDIDVGLRDIYNFFITNCA